MQRKAGLSALIRKLRRLAFEINPLCMFPKFWIAVICVGMALPAGGQSPGLAFIPGGEFQQGCTPGQQPCPGTGAAVHTTLLRDFALATHEVTQSGYLEVVGNNPSLNITCPACPVERVSWYGAVVYCNMRSIEEGLRPAYYSDAALTEPFMSAAGTVHWDTEAEGYRLPTEAEWEYAARGGWANQDLRYAGSNSWQAVAVTGGQTAPAGSLAPNAAGLFDMSGNVAEWCWDRLGNYPAFKVQSPRGVASGAERVYRGGHYQNAGGWPLASRSGAAPGEQSPTIGFRVARNLSRMVEVEGGAFTRGCTAEQAPDCQNDEFPPNTVTVEDFYLSRFEVTQSEWAALVPEYTPLYNRGEGDLHPTYRISWYDAATYCNRRSLAEGRRPAYYTDSAFTAPFDSLVGDQLAYIDVFWDASADGYRLPTEAEWEYAARGGALGGGYRYAGGDGLGEVGWYSGNSNVSSQPVGQKQPNALGIYDLTGNIYEWCWDWYDSDYYEYGTGLNPKGPASGTLRCIRGGSWNSTPGNSRVANRLNFLPGARRTTFAFRLARSKK